MLFLLVFYEYALINSTDTLNELRRKELYKFICYTVLTKGKHFKNKKWLVFHIQSNDKGISNHECCFALYIFLYFRFFLVYLSFHYLFKPSNYITTTIIITTILINIIVTGILEKRSVTEFQARNSNGMF